MIVECYFDKILFSEIFGKVKHVHGKMEALRKLMKKLEKGEEIREETYILDYDSDKSTEDIPENLKTKLNLKVTYEDDKVKVYASNDNNIKIILLKPNCEGFFMKFGGKIDYDTHTNNEKILRKIIEENKEVVVKIKEYFKNII